MISYEMIMVRFGELSTKGKNKKDFIQVLFKNIKNALKHDFPKAVVEKRFDHIYVHLNGESTDAISERLLDISGIHSLSFVHRLSSDINTIIEDSLSLIRNETGSTFKVRCKRADKSFPFVSDQIVRKVASHILKNTNLTVDVHQPDILLNIEVRMEATYIYVKTILALGGYPLGVGGKAMLMLSGGIDSPVAAYLLMRRGVSVECIHFASPPYTQIGVIYKLVDLLKALNRYQPTIRLHIIPFTKLQETIYQHVDESYAITIMRRMMYRLAEKLAKRRKCLAIANGESIGQVASQTLASMKVINAVTNYPIIRPLAVVDKLDIIKTAVKINTYDISIRPFEDCCTIFTPKNPKTMPKEEEVIKFEQTFDYETLIDEALRNIEVKIISSDEEN